jgi:hypothetical protein
MLREDHAAATEGVNGKLSQYLQAICFEFGPAGAQSPRT